MKIKKILSIFILLVFMNSVMLAFVGEENPQNQRRIRIRQNINTLLLLRMTQALDLTEEQAAKIFPKLNSIEKEKVELQRQIGIKMRELKLNLEEESLDHEGIASILDRVKELRIALKNKDGELERLIEENLSLIQQAKYLVFSQDFYRGLRQTLERARAMQERLKIRKNDKF